MKRLLYSLPGCLLMLSAAFVSPFTLSATEKKANRRPATIYTQSEFKLSNERMNLINSILDSAIKRNLDITKPATIVLIETEIAAKMPLTPKAKISNKTISQIAAEARRQVRDNVNYNAELANIKVGLEKEAAEKYPLAKPRTKVSFQYQKGPYMEKVEGIYYLSTERYAQINDKRITFIDMPDDLRAQFDRNFNAEKRKEYVDQKVRELESKKRDEIQATFTKLMAGQDILNEKNGYIYDRESKQWISAKEYLHQQLPAATEKYKAHKEQERLKELKAREQAEQRAMAQSSSRAVTAIDTSDEAKYKEILNAAKAKRMKLSETLSGVDIYQGYINALWGATRSDVAFLFSRTRGARYEYIGFNSKLVLPRYFPAEVFFHYNNNSLFKVEIDYGYLPQRKDAEEAGKSDIKRLFSGKDFNNLVITLHDICGESDEEKVAEHRNLFKEIENGTLTPEKLHPPKAAEEEDEEGEDGEEAKKPAPIPTDFVFTWTGKETKMTLTFRFDKASGLYQNVRVTKVKEK